MSRTIFAHETWQPRNSIKSKETLRNNSNLEILALGQNNIQNLKDISQLSKLPMLRDLSFSDPNFGDCPVVRGSSSSPLLVVVKTTFI